MSSKVTKITDLGFRAKRNKKALKTVKQEVSSPEKKPVEKLPESPKEETKENVQPVTPLSPKVEPISLETVNISSPVKPSATTPKSEEKIETKKPASPLPLPCLPTPVQNNEEPKPKSKSKKKSKDEDYVPTEKTSKSSTKKSKSTSKKSKRPIKEDVKQPKITNFFSRAKRVPAAEKRKIAEEQLKFYLANEEDDKLEHIVMKHVEGKGRGIFSTRPLQKGEFVVEYAGDRMSMEEGKTKEEEYKKDPEIGSYIYFFSFKGKRYCIDATSESGRYGRLLNHSKNHPNCKTRLVEEPEGHPRLIIEAKIDIESDTELLYDYGDRDKQSLKAHPWLAEWIQL